jgi:hypothetical protein
MKNKPNIVRAAVDAYFAERAQHRSIMKLYGDGVNVNWDAYRAHAIADLVGFAPMDELEAAVDAQIARLRKFEKVPPKE